MVRGRVRVELRGESGEPANEEIPNSELQPSLCFSLFQIRVLIPIDML